MSTTAGTGTLPPGTGPVGTATRTSATATSAALQAGAAASTARTLRVCMLVSSVIGALAFFVPWGIAGVGGPFGHTLYAGRVSGFPDGITIAELEPTHWWAPPSANLMLALALVALLLSIAMNLGARGVGVAAAIAVAGGGLAVFALDWAWIGRHYLDEFTGLWVVSASGLATLAFGLTYVIRGSRTS